MLRKSDSGLFEYSLTSEDTVRIIGYHGPDTVQVPAELNGHPVREIGREAFSGQKTITEIQLAFVRCVNLKRIEVDDENDAYQTHDGVLFDRRGRLLCCYPAGRAESVYEIPLGVYAIADHAFSWSPSLRQIQMPPGLVWIGEEAFAYCVQLAQADLPHGVTEVGQRAFMGCGRLESVRLPGTLTSLGAEAFNGCSLLQEIVFPCMLTQLEDGVFGDCSRLMAMELPEGMGRLGDGVFSGCTSLISVNLPVGLQSIGADAFRNCTALQMLEIPPEVVRVGRGAFSGCRRLVVITSKGSAAWQEAKRDHVRWRSAGVFSRRLARHRRSS